MYAGAAGLPRLPAFVGASARRHEALALAQAALVDRPRHLARRLALGLLGAVRRRITGRASNRL